MEILEIAIVGAALTGIINLIKKKYGTKGWQTKAITVGLSVVLGAGIYLLSGTAIWAAMLGVLGTASTVYAFFVK